MKRSVLILAVALAALPAAAAELADVAWLAGQWQGYSLMGDRSNVNRKTFEFEVGGRYLVERTTAMFPPAEPSVDYELHEDMTVYYATGGELFAKSFFSEGFVQSSTVKVSADATEVVIESTAVEGGPPGMRARLTYRREADDHMTGTFQLDWSGQGYKTASTYEFKKVF